MNFEDYLKQTAEEVELIINESLNQWKEEVSRTSPVLIPLAKVLIDNCDGGKRLRGVLVKLGFEMFSGKGSEIIKSSAAVEIFQTAILAHDDVIDLSPTRRGKPTIYRQLGGDHYGISQTICLGDIGFFLAAKLIANGDFEPSLKIKAIQIFNEMVISTGLGQMLDIELPHLNETKKEADVLEIHRLKTAYYTIVYPLTIGAILAGANQTLLDQIKEFGSSLGIAFQITDDILGVFGDEGTLGKSVTSDIEEGKNTLLITEALKNSDKGQREELEGLYGRGRISQEGLEKIRQIFKDTGALEYSQKKAEELVEKSKKVLEDMEIKEEYKNLLSEMSDFIIARKK